MLSGVNTCIEEWVVNIVDIENGSCVQNSDEQCTEIKPCSYRVEVDWEVKDNCAGMCKIVAKDAYQPPDPPLPPLVFDLPVTLGGGGATFEANCLCVTLKTTFALECESASGATHSSSYMLEFSCSECSLFYFPMIQKIGFEVFYPQLYN